MNSLLDTIAIVLSLGGLTVIAILALLLRDARRAVEEARTAALSAQQAIEAMERRAETSADAFEQTCADIGDSAETIGSTSIVIAGAAGLLAWFFLS